MKDSKKRAIIINLIGVILSRAIIYSTNPIAIAYFAAAYAHKGLRLFLLLGTVVGMATVLSIEQMVRYITVLFLFIVVVAIVEKTRKKIPAILMGAIVSVISVLVGLAWTLTVQPEISVIYSVLIEGIAVYALYNVFSKGINYFYECKRGQSIGNEELISVSVILAVMVYAMPRVQSLNFSIEETVGYLFLLVMGYKYGAGAGAIAGTASGFVFYLQNQSGNKIGILCILGICAGVFQKVGKIGSAITFLVTTVALGYFYEPTLLEVASIRALASAIVIFMCLPKSILYTVDSSEEKVTDSEAKELLQDMARQKLSEFAESFRRLSKTFYEISETKASLSREDINCIFDNLSEQLCKDCINCTECWKNNFYDTYRAAFSILSSAEKNGQIQREDIPVGFARQCLYIDRFVNETNKGLELAKLNLVWQNRMAQSREAIAGQLGEVATIIQDFSSDLYDQVGVQEEQKKQIIEEFKNIHINIKNISVIEKRNKKQEFYITAKTKAGRCITTREAANLLGELLGKRMKPIEGCKNIVSKHYETLGFTEDTIFKTLTGIAKVSKHNEIVSGDNYSFIYLNNGEMIMTLSDGMGTGQKACEESESVIELLEQFMEAGFKEESAIKLINSIMVLKSEEESCSTIDMSIINLFNGMCDFIKIGAAATFIKRQQWVETITSTSLPVGVFNQVDIEGVSKKLYNSDFVIMVTDGVLDCIQGDNKEEALNNRIADITSLNSQEIANTILEWAVEQNNHEAVDDMTVIVAGLWKK